MKFQGPYLFGEVRIDVGLAFELICEFTSLYCVQLTLFVIHDKELNMWNVIMIEQMKRLIKVIEINVMQMRISE